ncbi:MAG: tetratricopeptide repeat protein [Aggregatilineales bacterium]
MHPTRSVQGVLASQGPSIIERPRLLLRLQSALHQKLTLITAPPGFGKTTLVAQLTRAAEAPVAWQTIDERSRDLPNLYSQAINALSAITPSIKQLAFPYGYAAGELATLIANHLAENLTGDLIYVLDDVHRLTGAAPAEAWLRTLVTVLPTSCHLILASRSLPRLPLVEMIARGEVLAIGLDELRFTAPEIAELGTNLLGVEPAEDHVQQLVARLEGWPAGTVLALQPLPSELEQVALSGQGGPEALFEALARIMLQTQPPAIVNFLLASSTLTQLTPETCIAALGLIDSGHMLTEIQTRNLFVSRVPGALVYHALFRKFLQAELKSSDTELFTDLHTRAARWFESNDLPDEAFDHYINADLPASAAALAEHLTVAYFAQNRVETLLAWNNQLRQCATPAPRLAFRCAIIYADRYDYDSAEERLRETESARQLDQEDLSPARIHIQYGQINVQRGNYQQAANYVAHLADADPEPTNIRGRALNILGLIALQTGHTIEAIQHFEAALPLHRIYADNYTQSQFLQNLAAAYWRAGRLKDALAAFHEIVALQRSLGGASPLALALTSLGYAYHHLGDYKHAVAALQEGLSAIAGFPNRRAESYLLFNLADVRRDQGEMEEALALYNQALNAVGDNEPSLACTILSGISTLHRWENQTSDAVAATQAADQLARKHAIGNEGRTAQVALWAARIQDDPSAALQQLDAIAMEIEAQQERVDLLQALSLCAYAALLIHQTDRAAQYLDKAAQLSSTIGTTAPLAIEILHLPPLEAFLCQKPRQYSGIISAIEHLRMLQVKPERDRVGSEHLPAIIYSLRIVTFGQAHIIRDGKTIATSEWRPAARDLFLYLVFTKQATRDQICLNFWPDSPAKRARDNFHTTIYRIREVLGENVVVLDDGGVYRINPDISLWCDAYELEAISDQARVLSLSDARTEDLWRRAVGLYNGEFLPALDFEWAIDYRERLHEIYVEALFGLGRCIQTRSDYREALDIYKRALRVEPYREDIHQAIMTCYVANGAKHKALAQLKQLRQLLLKDLGIGPSKETMQFAKTLFA